MIACQSVNLETVKFLVELGADIDISDPDDLTAIRCISSIQEKLEKDFKFI